MTCGCSRFSCLCQEASDGDMSNVCSFKELELHTACSANSPAACFQLSVCWYLLPFINIAQTVCILCAMDFCISAFSVSQMSSGQCRCLKGQYKLKRVISITHESEHDSVHINVESPGGLCQKALSRQNC